MKKRFLTFLMLLLAGILFAQPGKKPVKEKPPAQSETNKYLEDAMKNMSPEEKKQMEEAMQMAKQMEQKGMTGNSVTGNDLKIPKKQTQLLNSMPVLASQQQYTFYLAGLLAQCKKTIPASVITEVDRLILKNSASPEASINTAPILFLEKNPAAAVYAAIRTAMNKPGNLLVQDNMAVILHQTGYPQKALPVLKYLLVQNNHPVILSNIAESYLSLGDTTNARKFFLACLQKDPDNCEANCGMGLLLTEDGRISEAIAYIIKSLKNGYTETADALAKKNKVKLKFSDIKPKVPEYFNAQKYKPVQPAYSMETVEPTEALRNELTERMRFWMEKKAKVNEEQNAKMEKETKIQLADRTRGYLVNTPFSKKAQLMTLLIGDEFAEFAAADYKNQYLPLENEYKAQMEKKLKDMYGGNQHYDNTYQECVKKIEILNEYLILSAKNHEAYQRATLPSIYEWVNQSLFWWRFIMNEDNYSIFFHGFISDFFEALHGYDQMQVLYPTPLWITSTCKDVKEPVKVKKTEDSLDINCPVSIKIPFGFGSYKVNCKGMEIEGGELAVFGFEKDFQSGEFSFAFGLGAEGNIPFFSAGTKGQMFFRFDKDFSPIDCGMKFEAGGEANVLGYNMEEKMTAVIGMASGIHVNAIDRGKEINIFEMDPTK